MQNTPSFYVMYVDDKIQPIRCKATLKQGNICCFCFGKIHKYNFNFSNLRIVVKNENSFNENFIAGGDNFLT